MNRPASSPSESNETSLSPTVGFARDEELPWVEVWPGIQLKVLRVVESERIWVVRNRFAPGTSIEKHRHTGDVHGFTVSGSWRYAEYGIDYPAGTYIYEPAGSVHTLTVPASEKEAADVVFVMRGENLVLGDDGEVTRVDDGPTTLAYYRMVCESLGLPPPPVLTT
jgi:2,4'-dihydroxyacetophenone dioxygenase